MGNCRDCKHWAWAELAPARGDWNPRDLHPCRGAPLYAFETDIGGRNLTEHVNLPVCTPPDFGCVQFAPKEPA